jgi:hypothetical protein
MASTRRFSIFRFSLRTLFVLLTGFALLLGYGANWSHQREAFLAKHEAGLFAKGVNSYRWGQRNPLDGCTIWQLPLLSVGAPRYYGITIQVPIEETRTTVVTHGWTVREIVDTQPDYAEAKRLFPECRVEPYAMDTSHKVLVQVRDSISGAVIDGFLLPVRKTETYSGPLFIE